jgi:hypothetical protein
MPDTSDASVFPRVALIGRHASPAVAAPLTHLATFLAHRGHAIVLEAETARYTPLAGHPVAAASELGHSPPHAPPHSPVRCDIAAP